jgi:hypothetical protein
MDEIREAYERERSDVWTQYETERQSLCEEYRKAVAGIAVASRIKRAADAFKIANDAALEAYRERMDGVVLAYESAKGIKL